MSNKKVDREGEERLSLYFVGVVRAYTYHRASKESFTIELPNDLSREEVLWLAEDLKKSFDFISEEA